MATVERRNRRACLQCSKRKVRCEVNDEDIRLDFGTHDSSLARGERSFGHCERVRRTAVAPAVPIPLADHVVAHPVGPVSTPTIARLLRVALVVASVLAPAVSVSVAFSGHTRAGAAGAVAADGSEHRDAAAPRDGDRARAEHVKIGRGAAFFGIAGGSAGATATRHDGGGCDTRGVAPARSALSLMQGLLRAHAEHLTKSKSKPLPAAGSGGTRRRRATPGQGGLRAAPASMQGGNVAFKVQMGEARASWRSRANLATRAEVCAPEIDLGRLILSGRWVERGASTSNVELFPPQRRAYWRAAATGTAGHRLLPSTASAASDGPGRARWEPSSANVYSDPGKCTLIFERLRSLVGAPNALMRHSTGTSQSSRLAGRVHVELGSAGRDSESESAVVCSASISLSYAGLGTALAATFLGLRRREHCAWQHAQVASRFRVADI
ncbi:hypothetical protein VTO73DRAFT_13367 [Trametes versicolor]